MARLGFTYSAHQHDAIVVRHCQLGPRMDFYCLLCCLLWLCYSSGSGVESFASVFRLITSHLVK